MIQIIHDYLGTISLIEGCGQPDWNSINDIAPIEKPYVTSIYPKATEIRNQYLTAQENADIIVPFMRTADSSHMYALEFVYRLDEDSVYVYYGYYNGSTMDKNLMVVYDYPYTGDEATKNFVFYLRRDRVSYAVKNLLNSFELYCCLNRGVKCTGTWEAPSSAWPNGVMRYNDTGEYIAITALPVNEVCIETSAAEKQKQQTIVAYVPYKSVNFGDANINEIQAVDGHFSDDPVIPDPTEDDDEGRSDDNDTKGGGGGKVRDYDPIPIPPIPTVTASSAGFFTLYRLEESDISDFASQLFSTDIITMLKAVFNDPLDFIAGCHILPFRPAASLSYYPKFGLNYWNTSYLAVDNGIVDFYCGSINIEEYWGSAYDYSPYTKLLIWLPYCGYKDLNPDEVMGQSLDVRYRIDVATGACVAFVSIGVVGATGPQIPRVLAQMTGNMATPVPASRVGYDNAMRNAISLVASIGAIAVGAAVPAAGAAGALTTGGVMSLAGAATSTVVSGKPNITRNGAIGASTGYMGVQVPYLIRVIPRLSLPSNYNNLRGYPSNMGGTLSGFTGYNEIAEIKLEGLNCTDDEYEEIERLVKEGIYI